MIQVWHVATAFVIMAVIGFACSGEFHVKQVAPSQQIFESSSTISITKPDLGHATQGPIDLEGRCVGSVPVRIEADGIDQTIACEDRSFRLQVTLPAPDGLKNIRVSQIDSLGQVINDSRSFVRDTTAPVVNLLSHAANDEIASTLTLSGNCESSLVIDVSVAGGTAERLECTDGTFSYDLTLSIPDGDFALLIRQVDPAGNVGSLELNLKKDTVAPVIALTEPLENAPSQGAVLFRGTCEANLVIAVDGAGLVSPLMIPCATNGTFNFNANLSAADGVKAIRLAQTDRAGNRTQIAHKSRATS